MLHHKTTLGIIQNLLRCVIKVNSFNTQGSPIGEAFWVKWPKTA